MRTLSTYMWQPAVTTTTMLPAVPCAANLTDPLAVMSPSAVGLDPLSARTAWQRQFGGFVPPSTKFSRPSIQDAPFALPALRRFGGSPSKGEPVEERPVERRTGGTSDIGNAPVTSRTGDVKVDTGTLSDGKKTVSLYVKLVLPDGRKLSAKVVPPKGTSDGFHEALDSKDLAEAVENTKILWGRIEELITADPARLKRPERICEFVDDRGGWKRYGAQAALATREMVFKLSAQYQGITLERAKHNAYRSIGGLNRMAFAHPMSVMLSAAKHGNGIVEAEAKDPWDAPVSKMIKGLPWQEWMVQMTFAKTPEEIIRAGEEFHDGLFNMLNDKGDFVRKLGKEGGMTVNLAKTPYEIIALFKDAVARLGERLGRRLELGRDVHLALDAAATEAYFPEKFVYDRSAALKAGVQNISGIGELEIDEVSKTVKLDRRQHYLYTENARGSGGRLLDFYTEGRYGIVLSDSDVGYFKAYLASGPADVNARAVKADLDHNLEADDSVDVGKGYRAYRLTSLQQVLLMRYIMDTTGNVFSSVEDIMAEDDWQGWEYASVILGDVQLVGDDSWVTNPARMVRSYREGVFNIIPLIKENQVADPWKAILMIALSENVQYLVSKGERKFVEKVVERREYDDLTSVRKIKKLISTLRRKVKEIGLPSRPVLAAVVSHRSKSYGPDVDAALALATGSAGKLGAIGSPQKIVNWPGDMSPFAPELMSRWLKYDYILRALKDKVNHMDFDPDSIEVIRRRKKA